MNFSFEPHSKAKLPIDSISLSIMGELAEGGGGGGVCVACQKTEEKKNRSAVMTAAHNSAQRAD